MLSIENITKKFSGVIALNDVSMELHRGRVNAIIGENGAGKSTLIKILSGVYHDYEGRIFYKGKSISFRNSKEAQESGISIIHQELNLIPYLSITENIFLGRELVTTWGMLNKRLMRSKAQSLMNKLKLNLDPDTLIADIKVGQQQVVEIAKALLIESEVIIMDEPTSAISEAEVEVLFGIIRDLKREGKTIVYISHKLDELYRIADNYVILRDGCFIEAGEMKNMNDDLIIQKMAGREIKSDHKTKVSQQQTTEILSIDQLCLQHPGKIAEYILNNISFTVAKGEVVGIFGLMGAGRTDLLETIFGLHEYSAGKIFIEKQEVHIKSPSDAINAGIAFVPEDRKKDGLVLDMDVRENISLTNMSTIAPSGLLNRKKELLLAGKYVDELKIKALPTRQPVKNLSGGNQQKVILAKWLATSPKVLLLDEPTRGVDVNAKNEIYKLINNLSGEGLGIVLVSSELPEILRISDKILVLAEGCLTAEFSATEATKDTILKAAIPKSI
jgi:ribose transport system ATP-binding protein